MCRNNIHYKYLCEQLLTFPCCISSPLHNKLSHTWQLKTTHIYYLSFCGHQFRNSLAGWLWVVEATGWESLMKLQSRCEPRQQSSEDLTGTAGSASKMLIHMAVGRRPQFPHMWVSPQDSLNFPMTWQLTSHRACSPRED